MGKVIEAVEVDGKRNKQLIKDIEKYIIFIEDEIEEANPELCRTKVLENVKNRLMDIFDIIDTKLGVE